MNSWKKITVLGLLFLFPSCLGWFVEKPTFTLKEIAVTRLSLEQINFLLGIEVQNPNHFDLKLRALEYRIYLNDQEVGKGLLEKEVRMAKSSSTIVQVPLQTDFRSLSNPLGFVLSGEDLRYKIEGAAIIKASVGTATIPFSKSGNIKIKN
ncbi:MAG: LEA type 2 family protein [Deltaproteobacteria bacterium]|nr:LEA type 2 family protein [Deltaproteobacteria bacterium]